MRGILSLARFRVAGFDQFGSTTQDFLGALAPLLGLTIAGTLLRAAGGEALDGLVELAMTLVALLTPPVLTHWLARRWGREAAWLRYATAFIWCHWAVLIVFALALIFGTTILTGAGVSPSVAVGLAELVWAGYGLALHWFLASRGLNIGRWRALLAVVVVELGTGALVVGPLLLGGLREMPGGAG